MLNNNEKREIIRKFAISDKDTGSCQIQIAILSKRIKQLSKHLQEFPKDKHSRLGLLKMVGKRKSFLNYLKKDDKVVYDNLLKSLKDENFM